MPIRINAVHIRPATGSSTHAYAKLEVVSRKLKRGSRRKDQKAGYHDARSVILADVPLTEYEEAALKALLLLIGGEGFSQANEALKSALATAFRAGIELGKNMPVA